MIRTSFVARSAAARTAVVLFAALAFAGPLAVGCGEGKGPVDDTFAELAGLDEKSDRFTGRLTVLGSINYGETKGPFSHLAGRWSALKFAGDGGDKVTVDVRSTNGDTLAWVLDNSFEILAFNDDGKRTTNSHIELKLPRSQSRTFYIVTREYSRRSMRFTVTLAGVRAPQFDTPCRLDTECALVRPDCCGLQDPIGVRADKVEAYRASMGCPANQICPRIAVRDNHASAECIANKCVAVLPQDVQCGGRTVNPHQCPSNFVCEGPQLAVDGTGHCTQRCGGIAGLACSGTDICVDDPNDTCDPRSGGADCMGVCRAAICSGVTSRCAPGFQWDQFACNCVERTSCGGFAGFPCAPGKSCIDDARDNCDPANGGADCPGVCVPSNDCRVTGCRRGTSCQFCWTNFACIPDGAVC